jgi:ribulose-5-phosphate 4-epimerase/fuculose-1-phosphate aldolase
MTRGGFDTTISQNSMGFHGRVGRLDYGGLADGEEEGNRIGSAIDDDTVVVMLENHGVLVIGQDVAEAWRNLYFLERACEVQVLAQSTGDELIHVPDEVVAKASYQWVNDSSGAAKLFASVKRKLDRQNPGYES